MRKSKPKVPKPAFQVFENPDWDIRLSQYVERKTGEAHGYYEKVDGYIGLLFQALRDRNLKEAADQVHMAKISSQHLARLLSELEAGLQSLKEAWRKKA